MCKLYKEAGRAGNLTIEIGNTLHMIGVVTPTILEILNDAGYDQKDIIILAWELDITEDTARELIKTMMKMPPKKIKKEEPKPKNLFNKNKNIDAMDVLLGLVNYIK